MDTRRDALITASTSAARIEQSQYFPPAVTEWLKSLGWPLPQTELSFEEKVVLVGVDGWFEQWTRGEESLLTARYQDQERTQRFGHDECGNNWRRLPDDSQEIQVKAFRETQLQRLIEATEDFYREHPELRLKWQFTVKGELRGEQ